MGSYFDIIHLCNDCVERTMFDKVVTFYPPPEEEEDKPCIQEQAAGCKAYSLGCVACPRHRALPYATDLGLSAQQVSSRRRRHCASINGKVDLNRHLMQFLHKMSPAVGFFKLPISTCSKMEHMKKRSFNLCKICTSCLFHPRRDHFHLKRTHLSACHAFDCVV